MSEVSKIEWTEASWNPVTGCKKISPGCNNCYAQTFAERFRGVSNHPYQQGFDFKIWPQRLVLPLTWKKPKKIFVNSMSDLFHEKVPDEFIAKVFDTMTKANIHVFQVLTKRVDRMVKWTSSQYSKNGKDRKLQWPENVWIGVSVENQDYTYRIELMKNVPAKIKFISFEPLLGPVKLTKKILMDIDWVIVGGESGYHARLMDEKWVSNIYEKCIESGIPFFFKQWGTFNSKGVKVGKKKAGRYFKKRIWNEMPRI